MNADNAETAQKVRRASRLSWGILMAVWLACFGDRQAPQVQIASPTDGSQVGGTVDILVVASDNKGVTRVEIYVDNSRMTSLTVSPYTYAWSTEGLPDSSRHEIQAKAYDAAENEGTSSIVSVLVRNSAPNTPAAPFGPSSGSINTLYDFSITTTDPEADSISTRCTWSGGDTSGWSPLITSGETASFDRSWRAAGSYRISAQAKDKRGVSSNWSPEHTIVISAGNGGWTRAYGTTEDEHGSSVVQTSDGGYIVAGTRSNPTSYRPDVYLIRTNATGDTLWSRTYGGSGGDDAWTVLVTADGGYAVVAQTTSFGAGKTDIWLLKLNAQGDTLWTRSFGGPEDDWTGAWQSSLQQTTDGGYVIVGQTRSLGDLQGDVYLVKTDANGNALWTRTYGGPDEQAGYAVRQTSDGGYIVTGIVCSGSDSSDLYLVKTSSAGDTVWTRTYGGSGYEAGSDVLQMPDGGYAVLGSTSSSGAGLDDLYLLRTDADGRQVWSQTYGGSDEDYGRAVLLTSDGGCLLVGESGSSGDVRGDVYLVKTDATGGVVWTRTYGGADRDVGYSAGPTSDGGFVIVGETESFGAGQEDVFLVKTDANGNTMQAGLPSPSALGLRISNPVFRRE